MWEILFYFHGEFLLNHRLHPVSIIVSIKRITEDKVDFHGSTVSCVNVCSPWRGLMKGLICHQSSSG